MSVSVTREPSGLVRISRRVPPALDAASTGALRFDLAEVRAFALAVKAGALDTLLGLPTEPRHCPPVPPPSPEPCRPHTCVTPETVQSGSEPLPPRDVP